MLPLSPCPDCCPICASIILGVPVGMLPGMAPSLAGHVAVDFPLPHRAGTRSVCAIDGRAGPLRRRVGIRGGAGDRRGLGLSAGICAVSGNLVGALRRGRVAVLVRVPHGVSCTIVDESIGLSYLKSCNIRVRIRVRSRDAIVCDNVVAGP